MTDLRIAAQQALEALGLWATGRDMDAVALNDLINRLESALAEPVQEPVAWMEGPYLSSGPTGSGATMSDLRTAAQQALEALESADWYINQLEQIVYSDDDTGTHEERAKVQAAITALRAALAEPVQEPVAWMVYTLDGQSVCVTDNPEDFTPQHRTLPLYTAPPQSKPLTEQQIWDAVQHDFVGGVGFFAKAVAITRAIERAHGIT